MNPYQASLVVSSPVGSIFSICSSALHSCLTEVLTKWRLSMGLGIERFQIYKAVDVAALQQHSPKQFIELSAYSSNQAKPSKFYNKPGDTTQHART